MVSIRTGTKEINCYFNTEKKAREFMRKIGKNALRLENNQNESGYNGYLVKVKSPKNENFSYCTRVYWCHLCKRRIEIGEKFFYKRFSRSWINICMDCLKEMMKEVK